MSEQANLPDPRDVRIAELESRNRELEARIKQLEALVESLRRGGKRQAAPFSRGNPVAEPKKPGRKPGDDYGTKAFRAVPPVIDEKHDAPLPEKCPNCGNNAFIDERVELQYQAEIPRRPIYRQFNVKVARCTCCKKRVQGRHPLQTSDALGCCASQIGPEAQAAAAMLNKELGLSQGKISRFFQAFFGIKLSRGGSCQIMLRAAERCAVAHQAIVRHVQAADVITADETGWRINGRSAWMHAAVCADAVAYLIDNHRGFQAMVKLIGEFFAGKLIHDGYASYDKFLLALHQTCLAHLLRRCRELLETATRGAVNFPRKVKALLQKSLEIRDRRDDGQITLKGSRAAATRLDKQMDTLLAPFKAHQDNERFAAHLWKHAHQLFTFLRHKNLDATNFRAEQAIRPAVVNRKVWGGNRTRDGATAQAILMTVLFTATKNNRDAIEFISQTLCRRPNDRPMLLTG